MTIMESVVLIGINDKKQVLAVSRKDDYNDFGLVGGKIEQYESPERAMIRELKEETGIELNVNNLRFVFDTVVNQERIHIFTARFNNKPVKMDNEGIPMWTDWQTVFNGCFGSFNQNLYNWLKAKNII